MNAHEQDAILAAEFLQLRLLRLLVLADMLDGVVGSLFAILIVLTLLLNGMRRDVKINDVSVSCKICRCVDCSRQVVFLRPQRVVTCNDTYLAAAGTTCNDPLVAASRKGRLSSSDDSLNVSRPCGKKVNDLCLVLDILI